MIRITCPLAVEQNLGRLRKSARLPKSFPSQELLGLNGLALGGHAGAVQVGLLGDVEEITVNLESAPVPQVKIPLLAAEEVVDLDEQVEATGEQLQVVQGVEMHADVGAEPVGIQTDLTAEGQLILDEGELAADAGADEPDVHADLSVDL